MWVIDMAPIIETKNIYFSYNGAENILNNVTFSIEKGHLITLLGPNGAGKSTLLGCICGLNIPQQGEIILCGENISKISRKEIAQKIAYVPQRSSVAFDYSVRDFVVMGRTAHLNMFSIPNDEDYEKTSLALEKLGISHLAFRAVGELSGGEQQKVCIARAIVQEPKLILLDEPASSLDYGNQIRLLKLIKELSSLGYSILMTTHNIDHCLMLESDVAILSSSGHLETGPLSSILTEELLSNVYGTELKLAYIENVKRTVCVPFGL